MIDVNQLRNGTAFELEGEPFLVVKYQFTKMGRGKGSVKVRVRNLKTGAVVDKSFITGNKVQEIQLDRKKLQYLYSDSNQSRFMDPNSFEQIEIDNQLIKDEQRFFKEGMEIEVLFWGDNALAVQLPAKLKYVVKQTGPGVKGNSATNIFKPAVLENEMKIKVPLFIRPGEKVWVETSGGSYVARAKQAKPAATAS